MQPCMIKFHKYKKCQSFSINIQVLTETHFHKIPFVWHEYNLKVSAVVLLPVPSFPLLEWENIKNLWVDHLWQKRFYIRKTIAALNYEIHQISFYPTQITNPFLSSRILSNKDKVQGLTSQCWNPYEGGLFLYCRISFPVPHLWAMITPYQITNKKGKYR